MESAIAGDQRNGGAKAETRRSYAWATGDGIQGYPGTMRPAQHGSAVGIDSRQLAQVGQRCIGVARAVGLFEGTVGKPRGANLLDATLGEAVKHQRHITLCGQKLAPHGVAGIELAVSAVGTTAAVQHHHGRAISCLVLWLKQKSPQGGGRC